MLTIDKLLKSSEFKSWVGDDQVRLVHNPYADSDVLPAFIVVHSEKEEPNKFSITRFWASPNRKDQLDRIHVSSDYKEKTVDEVFKLLLTEYSKGLD